MKYSTINGSKRLFVLFHGTGGNDTDLLFLTGELDPFASVIGFLGNVGSGISRRFFAPLVNGKLDRQDFNTRVQAFIEQWNSMDTSEYEQIIFVGYSNGANFLLGVLEQAPDIADMMLLLHPSALGWDFSTLTPHTQVLLTIGANDYIAPAGNFFQIKKDLHERGLDNFNILLLDGEHAITDHEVNELRNYLQQFPVEA